MMINRIATLWLVAIVGCLSASPSFAHHVMGGATPTNFWQGLLSGIAHPVIGIDHFAFLVVMGIAAAFTVGRFLSPLVFVITTIVGCLLVSAGWSMPGIELGVALSVVLLGAMVLSGRHLAVALAVVLFAVAGSFHGMAYGAAIIGAETSPLLAYLIGFGCIQYVVAIVAGTIAIQSSKGDATMTLHPRLAGAVVTGIGIAILIENIETLLVT